MSLRESKNKVIDEIMYLRAVIGSIDTLPTSTVELGIDQAERNRLSKEHAQEQLNKIQDIVFGM